MLMLIIGGYFSGVADSSSLAIDTQGGHGQTDRAGRLRRSHQESGDSAGVIIINN
jgi:hypothetical protein